jgi:TM2 domain-containing membrane protein YozV
MLASLGFAQQGDTASRIGQDDSTAIAKRELGQSPKPKNAGITLAASLVIPGGGQIYTGHYVMGGLFFATEAILGLYVYNRYLVTAALKHNADSTGAFWAPYRNWVRKAGDTTGIDSAFFGKLEADSADMEKKEQQNVLYQSIAWMVGVYYYNVLDALQGTNLFKSDSKKDPVTAAWLSAIPGLGLGQMYNGELSKAGMIFMIQMDLAYVAINYHLIMRDCEKYEAAIDPNNADQYNLFKGPQLDKWESRRTEAFRNRNMWMWYSVAFYLYGIFDAVVDANLHDARVKMKLEPDLNPQTKEIGLHASMNF